MGQRRYHRLWYSRRLYQRVSIFSKSGLERSRLTIYSWDTEILRRALNDPVCNTREDITFQQCPVFQPFIQGGSCRPERGVLTESFAHNDLVPVTRLPGCNPLWTSGPKPGCSSMPSDPDVSPHRATDGPKVASQAAVPDLPTLPGWKQISCIKDSDNMLLNKIRSYDNSVSQSTCLDACFRSGYSYASIGRAWGNSWVGLLGRFRADCQVASLIPHL